MDLTPLAGRRVGRWRTWVEPDTLYGESPIKATVEVTFAGAAAVVRYTAQLDGDVDGFVLIGKTQDQPVVAWLDTWHTGGLVMASYGRSDDPSLEVAATYHAGEEEWQWTSEYGLDPAGRLVIRHYNQGPAVPRYLGVEAVLERVET